jgi:FkbH-like protein
MKCALLSNSNIESLSRRVDTRHEMFIAEGYGSWIQELANPTSAMWRFGPAAVVLLLDGTELLHGYEGAKEDALFAAVDEQITWIERAAELAPAVKFFVSNIDVPPLSVRSMKQVSIERRLEAYWYDRLVALGARVPNMYVMDVKGLIEGRGREQFYSKKRWYLGGMKYSVVAEKTLAKEITRTLNAIAGTGRKKCLLVDLDNTLWGGVIGEDGLEGIQLSQTGEGARYRDFQRRIRQLEDLGVILAIVSKNNYTDVQEVFDNHADMVLKKDDFASLKINWSTKPQNIAEVAQDLDIGSDSFVFIDDNPVDREAVRSAMPEVTVPDFPADTTLLPAFLDQIYQDYFFALESTEEDRKRTETYLQNAKRAAERHAAWSVEEFLAALKTKITVRKVMDEDLPRAAQLTQKTNQFNLTTRRYTEQDLQGFRRSADSAVYIASVSDKFGDNGKTFLAILKKATPDTAEVDTFLMSCRVMGRFIEDQILDHLVRELRQQNVAKLRLHFFPTKKNTPARAMLDRLKGKIVSQEENGNTTWEYDLTQGSPVTQPGYAELMPR